MSPRSEAVSGAWEKLGLVAVALLAILVVAGRPEGKDYISYWSAGKLLWQHADPYSVRDVFALERTQGYDGALPLVMRNPPWALFLALPLGMVSPRLGLAIWLGAAVLSLMAFLNLLRFDYKYRVLTYCFTPFLVCLITGQSSAFLLLGLSLFLAFHRSRPYMAGSGLLLVGAKPHVLFLLWPLLLLHCLLRREFRILVAAALALVSALAVAFEFDPHVWGHYYSMLHDASIGTEILSTPSFALRRVVSINSTWLQLVPASLGLAWAAWFYMRNRRFWDWSVHLVPVLFVSVLTCPYVWTTDEVVLLPAIMLTLAHAEKRKHATLIFIALNLIPFIMLMLKMSLPTGAYWWTSAAWFTWYLYSRGVRVLVEPTDRVNEAKAPQLLAA